MQPAPEDVAWSANDGLARLRACADGWGGAILAMLADDRPPLRPINPWTWIKQTNDRDLEFGPSFRASAAQRAELLAVLEPLSREGWDRAATGMGAGKPLERTVRFSAEWTAPHERPHGKQIERIISALHKRRPH